MVSSSGIATAVLGGLAVVVGGRVLFGDADEGAAPQFQTEVTKISDSFRRSVTLDQAIENFNAGQLAGGGSQKGPSTPANNAGESQSQSGPSRSSSSGGGSSRGPIDHGPEDVVDVVKGETFVKPGSSLVQVERDLATPDTGGFRGTPSKEKRGIIGGRS